MCTVSKSLVLNAAVSSESSDLKKCICLQSYMYNLLQCKKLNPKLCFLLVMWFISSDSCWGFFFFRGMTQKRLKRVQPLRQLIAVNDIVWNAEFKPKLKQHNSVPPSPLWEAEYQSNRTLTPAGDGRGGGARLWRWGNWNICFSWTERSCISVYRLCHIFAGFSYCQQWAIFCQEPGSGGVETLSHAQTLISPSESSQLFSTTVAQTYAMKGQ